MSVGFTAQTSPAHRMAHPRWTIVQDMLLPPPDALAGEDAQASHRPAQKAPSVFCRFRPPFFASFKAAFWGNENTYSSHLQAYFNLFRETDPHQGSFAFHNTRRLGGRCNDCSYRMERWLRRLWWVFYQLFSCPSFNGSVVG